MKIEPLTMKDLPSLSDLFYQFWGETSSIEKMQTTYSKMAENPAYILIAAKQDSQVVGFVMGIICEELYGDCRPFMVIEDMIVDKNQRRSGVGAALIREMEKNAVENDCYQVILITEADRTDAVTFYGKLGYNFEPYKGFKKRITRD